ncbi:PhoD-like phosphatase, metallophosphatase domain [Dillenia turbinata]|uniref:PhoD-like phosphatase, metallophosphatase domain n=1 Tax=Dillenia turbinata TaxID=194707 RepID=A0AAN8ZFM1_9MAGN
MAGGLAVFTTLIIFITPQLSYASQVEQDADADADAPIVSRIAFGSCANQSAPQPIWNAIIDFDPQIFIWLGDNIYGDIRRPFRLIGKKRTIGPWKNVPQFVPATEQEMQSKYMKAKRNPEFAGKVTSQRLLLDFLDEPVDSPRRMQAGVYASYTLGPEDRQVKVILLDTRYHRDPLFSDGTILGSLQWEWLKKELNGPASAITIIASSIQVISNLSAATGPLFYLESWARFPRERACLFKLIADSKRDGVLFISGDVHFGEISRHDCATGYPMYDITSSGLTQAVEKVLPAPLHFMVRLVAWLTPTTMRVMGHGCRYRSCTYGQPNFGVIEIDWDATPVALKVEIRDVDGFSVSCVNILLSELQAQNKDLMTTMEPGSCQRHCTLEIDLPWIVRHRLAFIFFSVLAVLLFALSGVAYAAVSVGEIEILVSPAPYLAGAMK